MKPDISDLVIPDETENMKEFIETQTKQYDPMINFIISRIFTCDIKFLLTDGAQVPMRAKDDLGNACYDIYALEDVILRSHQITKVKTGIRSEFSPDFMVELRPRSGLSAKGLLLSLGTIDSNYRGEWMCSFYNPNIEPYHVKAGDRIAQARPVRLCVINPEIVTELSDTERGEGGFGSTGKQ
ncbi:MAG: dUTP diphosphatase [Candidatus Gracilibacteria bacterium]|jgi:dUTP pyrophosphatase